MKHAVFLLFIITLSFGCDFSDQYKSKCVVLLCKSKVPHNPKEMEEVIQNSNDKRSVAHAYLMLGTYYRKQIPRAPLGRECMALLQKSIESYIESIQQQIEEYTLAGTFQTALLYYDYFKKMYQRNDFKGKNDMKSIAKIQYINALDPYLEKSLEKCIMLFKITNGDVDVCADTRKMFEVVIAEIVFLQGRNLEDMALIYKEIPLESLEGDILISDDELDLYREVQYDKYLELIERALSKYRQGEQSLSNLSVSENEWTDSLQNRISRIEKVLKM